MFHTKLFLFLAENENPSCYVQTCEQLIMGRNLRYQEALRIIQNEEYLEAADFDMVLNRKKKRRKKRDFASIQTSTKPIKKTQGAVEKIRKISNIEFNYFRNSLMCTKM